jgi:hypothetical protein
MSVFHPGPPKRQPRSRDRAAPWEEKARPRGKQIVNLQRYKAPDDPPNDHAIVARRAT